jgi:hypothetical protein
MASPWENDEKWHALGNDKTIKFLHHATKSQKLPEVPSAKYFSKFFRPASGYCVLVIQNL